MSSTIAALFRDADILEATEGAAAAAELYKRWVALNPDDPHIAPALFNMAVVAQRGGDPHAAINALRAALKIDPDFHPPYINLGRALEDLGQTGDAVTQWLALVNRLPAVNGPTLRHKLIALHQLGRVLEANHADAPAEDALRQAIDLSPENPQAVQHWIALRQRQCKWPVVQGWDGIEAKRLLANISPLSTAVLFDDPLFQLARNASYARQSIPRPQHVHDHTGRRGERPARLKIGYVSSDLREHAVGFGLTEAMELHDRSRFDIHAYYCGIPREDGTRARIRNAVKHWTDITGLSDDAAAARIAADGIDILVDVNGYTRDARTAVFARRPAPIAANWFGFPGSMATPYHHYVIADANVAPEGSEIYFTERVLRLACYQPNDRKRPIAAEPPQRSAEGLPETGFVFCCLNGTQKITPQVFGAWMKILAAVEGSVLWLLDSAADANARLRAMAAATGIAPERLCFAPKRPNPQHLARYALADLFLDTFPYGAHTTASDSMWMGTPVLTLEGRGFAARVCAGLVKSAGMPDLVCTSLEDYISRAIAIAEAPGAAAELRRRLRANREHAVLFDTPQLVKSLEALYDRMWEEFRMGDLPVPNLTNLPVYEEIGLGLIETRQGGSVPPELYAAELARWMLHEPLAADGRLLKPAAVETPPQKRAAA
ncbi:MAG: glycosyl transferase [Aestuariivirga sp.]|uniref:O-linked N-acetylglucosamine transferase, SPINDLY family protein n=1 Tax=Aestuariivirga sp. TaxID=2650926 RepID=UPI0025C4FD8A|nr:glycosyl transferase [Aestuariivirga sp.]MCA3559564.1 glycosyl transferase [Aestuariivirga sp.]